jgi:hypothetical protein
MFKQRKLSTRPWKDRKIESFAPPSMSESSFSPRKTTIGLGNCQGFFSPGAPILSWG